MTTSQLTVRTLAAFILFSGFGTAANAQPPAVTVDWALKQSPRQQGVNISTPRPEQAAQCKVTPIPKEGAPGKSMGAIVAGPDGKTVRQFVSYDDKNFNIIVYFLEGQEAYREVYPPDAKEPIQFRWLGANGSKWGLDHNRDGKIDEWVVISPEEVSQELAQAVIASDPDRIRAMLVTKENLTTLALPAPEVDKILARAANATKRVADTSAALKLSDKARWVHVEYGVPNTRPADSFGGREDFTVHKNGTIFIEDGGKGHAIQTGELVQIGRAWKLVDGPSAGAAPIPQSGGTDPGLVTPEIKELVDRLNDLDKKAPTSGTLAAIAEFNARRAEILEQINEKLSEDKKETWLKMLLDSHAAAAEAGKPSNPHIVRLKQFKDAYAKANANQVIAAYAAYRSLYAEVSVAMTNMKDANEMPAIQDKWRAGLEAFVTAFPQSADAPEALWRLAMAHEHSSAKDAEAKARQWFNTLAKSHSGTPQGAKAVGAMKRLDSEGKPLDLVGQILGTNQQFDAGAQPGKVVVVYYWASWSGSLTEEAKKLQSLAKDYEKKGLVLVTVSLDHDAKQASDAIKITGLPGTHLFAEGGLERSPLGASYGILAPPHVFVAGKDGKVVNRNAGVATLEDDLKKLLGDK